MTHEHVHDWRKVWASIELVPLFWNMRSFDCLLWVIMWTCAVLNVTTVHPAHRLMPLCMLCWAGTGFPPQLHPQWDVWWTPWRQLLQQVSKWCCFFRNVICYLSFVCLLEQVLSLGFFFSEWLFTWGGCCMLDQLKKKQLKSTVSKFSVIKEHVALCNLSVFNTFMDKNGGLWRREISYIRLLLHWQYCMC